MYLALIIFGIIIFAYSIVAGKLDRTVINGAVVYIVIGLLIGPLAFNLLHLEVDADVLSGLAELTLALVLFADATNANLGTLKKSFLIPQRMLLIGLPLTIALGFGIGIPLLGSLTLLEVAILSTMLAPTDAALGKAVVTDERVPARFREGLNIESGLNDGICVPILFLFLAMISGGGEHAHGKFPALTLFAEEIGIGSVVGISVAVVGALLVKACMKREWITETWSHAPIITLAFVSFAGAQMAGGSGFIATFVGGLVFGSMMKKEQKHHLLLAAENTGDVLALMTWVLFGAVVIPHFIGHFSWQAIVYAVLSLTVIRMLPIFLSLSGMGLKTGEKLFLGWFGPRGLASIVFAVIVVHADLPGGDLLSSTVVATIILSVIAHGLSARPLAAALAKISPASGDDS